MGSSDLKYEVAQNAYIKLVLHSLKHPTSAVNGVLIGRISPSNDTVEITDAVPLFHSHIPLLPQLEISLILIEEYFSAKGLNIVGYFHANERSDDYELSGVAKNIGDQICRYFPQAAILLLDNKKLEALKKSKGSSAVVQLYVRDASKNWKLVQSDGNSRFALKEPSANLVLLDYISSEKWKDIVDFDDHLDDISKALQLIPVLLHMFTQFTVQVDGFKHIMAQMPDSHEEQSRIDFDIRNAVSRETYSDV